MQKKLHGNQPAGRIVAVLPWFSLMTLLLFIALMLLAFPTKNISSRETDSVVPTASLTKTANTAAQQEKADDPEFTAEQIEFFESKIRPILVDKCFECHGPESGQPEGGLSLASRANLLAGGETGPAIVAGDPDKSLLIEAVNYDDVYEMPPDSKLPDEEIQLLRRWVEMGAPWPATDQAVKIKELFNLEERKADHWCWQAIARQEVPAVSDRSWPADPVDQFILKRLEDSGLKPAADAHRRSLLRRLSFDLTGLPPTLEELQQFVDDRADDAVEKAVDRLLASERFGEHWARHWMDLVRYAETGGHEFDYPIPNAWRYRDYLIRALNNDVPYDQLITEHIAGDLVDSPRRHPDEDFNESILGTGFWFLGEDVHAPVDVRLDQLGHFDNQIDVMSRTFLGVTVACAKCHDHKFDAISTADFYAIAGFLKSSRRQNVMLDPGRKIENTFAGVAEIHRASAGVAGEYRRLIRSGSQQIVAGESGQLENYLAAAIEVLQSVSSRREGNVRVSVARTAADHELDEEILQRVIEAIESPALADPLHPVHLLQKWTLPEFLEDPAANPWKKLRRRIGNSRKRKAPPQSEQDSVLFADFRNGIPDGWFRTGFAFEPVEGQSVSATGGLAPAGVSSGLHGKEFQGVLRSPTFTIDHDAIHIRLAGAGPGAQVRVVVEGHWMDRHNALLFKGLSHEVAAPKAGSPLEFRTHVQAGDLKLQRGHRAHIELIDQGDGWLAIEEIRFRNEGGKRDAFSDVSVALANASSDLLADPGQFARLAAESVAQMIVDESYGTDSLVNWIFENRLSVLLDGDASQRERELRSAAKQIRELAGGIPSPLMAVGMADGTPEDEFVLIRGNHETPGDPVPRRFLTALSAEENSGAIAGSGRLDLAARIADGNNPLTARVMVNRLWHHLMGRGLVESVDNFGVLGKKPTHPELLDYLAAEFVRDGWSIKRMVRRLVLTRTYQMSTAAHAGTAEKATVADPDNRMLYRANIKRITAESIRDSMLKVSGQLDVTMYGSPVPVFLTNFMQGRGRPGETGPLDGNGRRSIYLEVRRNFLSPVMLAFDAPIPLSTIGKRNYSNVPAQALILMNDPLVIELANRWAGKLIEEPMPAEDRIQRMFESALGRPPTARQRDDAMQFLKTQAAELEIPEQDIDRSQVLWRDLCHVLFNSKQFIYLD